MKLKFSILYDLISIILGVMTAIAFFAPDSFQEQAVTFLGLAMMLTLNIANTYAIKERLDKIGTIK